MTEKTLLIVQQFEKMRKKLVVGRSMEFMTSGEAMVATAKTSTEAEALLAHSEST